MSFKLLTFLNWVINFIHHHLNFERFSNDENNYLKELCGFTYFDPVADEKECGTWFEELIDHCLIKMTDIRPGTSWDFFQDLSSSAKSRFEVDHCKNIIKRLGKDYMHNLIPRHARLLSRAKYWHVLLVGMVITLMLIIMRNLIIRILAACSRKLNITQNEDVNISDRFVESLPLIDHDKLEHPTELNQLEESDSTLKSTGIANITDEDTELQMSGDEDDSTLKSTGIANITDEDTELQMSGDEDDSTLKSTGIANITDEDTELQMSGDEEDSTLKSTGIENITGEDTEIKESGDEEDGSNGEVTTD